MPEKKSILIAGLREDLPALPMCHLWVEKHDGRVYLMIRTNTGGGPGLQNKVLTIGEDGNLTMYRLHREFQKVIMCDGQGHPKIDYEWPPTTEQEEVTKAA